MSSSGWFGILTLAAAGSGLLVGYLTRSGASSGPARPAAVETLLRAVDRGDLEGVARALQATGPAITHPPPWREEVEMAALIAADDLESLGRFATTPPKGAARARALLWLRARGKTPADRERAARRLATDYPRSWATAPGAERAGGGGR